MVDEETWSETARAFRRECLANMARLGVEAPTLSPDSSEELGDVQSGEDEES